MHHRQPVTDGKHRNWRIVSFVEPHCLASSYLKASIIDIDSLIRVFD